MHYRDQRAHYVSGMWQFLFLKGAVIESTDWASAHNLQTQHKTPRIVSTVRCIVFITMWFISPRKCDIWVSSRATSYAPVSMVSHARFRFCLGNYPFSREKVSCAPRSCSGWLLFAVKLKVIEVLVNFTLPQCMNCRLTQGQLVVAAAAATRTSYQWHRGKASNVFDEGPGVWGGRFFLSGTRRVGEWVSERDRKIDR